jgi:hypothetical protein
VETEVLGPLMSLEPGEEHTFDVWWNCARLRAASVERVTSCAVISRDLELKPEEGALRVAASFGVFQAGSLELVSLRKDGRVAAVQPAGSVTPLAPCALDERIPAPEDLFRVSLRMRNRSGDLLGTIANARVHSPQEFASNLTDCPD